MNIIEDIKKDIFIAKSKKENLLKFALENLLESIEDGKTKKEIYHIIEREIENKGQKIIRSVRKNNVKNSENDIYIMNLYNSYLCKYFLHKKRRIVLKHGEEEDFNAYKFDKHFEIQPKIIEKVKRRRLFKKIFF